MNWILQAAQIGMSAWLATLTREKQDEYEQAVDRQIAEGKTGSAAMQSVAMDMVKNDHSSLEAGRLYRSLGRRLSNTANQEVGRSENAAKKRRTDFLENYDARTGQYLDQNDMATQSFLADLNNRNAGTSADYATRETDVMGLLEGQGDQALKDAELTYGQETEKALGDLNARGLGGSGVGSSVRGGFATQKADELARIRERARAQKAETLAVLRGDRLSFNERATNVGAGFTESGINRRLGASADVESGRAAYDAAMSGEVADRRGQALDRAYEVDTNTGTLYADWLNSRGDLALNTYLDTTRYGLDFGQNVNHVPPDWGQVNQSFSSTGRGLGGFGG